MRIWGKKMNKKLLLSSLLVLTLLLLMPSIPAIQHNIFKKDIKDKMLTKLPEDLDFKDLREIVNSVKVDKLKHPLLYFFVILVAGFRWIRCLILGEISLDIIPGEIPGVEIRHPILFLRCMWLIATVEFWDLYWNNLSDKYGWNWKDIHDIIWVK